MCPKGTYCLILNTDGCTVSVGSLKSLVFNAGYYIYVGSALGPGGLKRMHRHQKLACQKDKKPRWHIDYLLIHPDFEFVDVVYTYSEKHIECDIAGNLQGDYVPKFGCSDCSCQSHLFHRLDWPANEIKSVIETIGLKPKMLGKDGDS
ncbi:GIY-YIG nuclease family protein [Methanohalophilus sp. RSK]|uniref:GIY-YIG nuclease family protein n=1 Tax=Methanohalophilus sp. RSK TaxID=2485783 RepID=UPI000F43E481|nr:GIY-YIG nuclease family protein [Methanohalophilus sp. RSK]RNI12076.1 GIY-YIG nuclease family protein [Methanohalophilus sp. RSK]